MLYKINYKSLILGEYNRKLILCDWKNRTNSSTIIEKIENNFKKTFINKKTQLLEKAISELDEFFSKKRRTFSIPLFTVGTDFQKIVWEEIKKIPYGKTTTYKEIAKTINRENSVRAVANAIGANKISIFIPCHRIIGSDGKLTGYAGGINQKKILLAIERNLVYN